MNTYSPSEYWNGVAERAGGIDSTGYAPVLHPDAPAWFNRLIDRMQFRAVRKAIAMSGLESGDRILDIGCGTGRWLRRYAEFGFQPTGIDATQGMLRLARSRGTNSPLLAAEAFRLPFADATFDCVSDVTVVQHIPAELQPKALAEMIRVLKPNGSLILFELIRGAGAHIFPRDPHDWICQVANSGGRLVGWFGQEFLLLDRVFVRIARALAGSNGRQRVPQAPTEGVSTKRSPASRRLYWALRHVSASISAWVDPAAQKFLPQKLATHGVFVFRK